MIVTVMLTYLRYRKNLDRAKEMLVCEFPKKLILNTKLKGLSYVLNLEREETREKYDHMMED